MLNSSAFKISTVLVALSILASCATKPENIQAAYVSPTSYERLTCNELKEEAGRVSQRAAAAAGVQTKKAKQDAVATGVAIVVFWPAAFFIKGDGATSAEVARLKGEMQAIEQTSRVKKCDIQFAAQS